MENIDPRLRSTGVTKQLTIESITDRVLRTRTLQVLLIVPTADLHTAVSALLAAKRNVEDACWLILERQYQQGNNRLPLNGLIDSHTRACVQQLQRMHPESNTQECYVAIRIAKGSLDDATKHVEWMQNQKLKCGGQGIGFLVAPDWTAHVKPEW